jgi:hypothetical protein
MMNLGNKSHKPLKRKSTLKKSGFAQSKTKIPKFSKLGLQKNTEKKLLLQQDFIFYKNIWSIRQHYCFETGVYLGEELNLCFFHHVLPKENYPQYRHCAWNIVLLAQGVHNQVETNIEFCPKVNKLTKQLILKHKNNECSN